MNTADLHTMTGAYAVHALTGQERMEFERHLTDCAACGQEVRELTATAERLGLAVALTPPPELKDRVMRQITTVRQEAPHVPVPPRSTGGTAGRVRRMPVFVLAACVAAAGAFGGIAVWQYQTAEDARQEALRAQQSSDELARVLTAPDARLSTAELPGGATGTVVVSRSRDQAAFLAADMPEPPGGTVYQLWFDDDGTMRPAGLMDPSGSSTAVLMEGPVAQASGMGITVEPAGGSEQPTSDPVAVMDLPAV